MSLSVQQTGFRTGILAAMGLVVLAVVGVSYLHKAGPGNGTASLPATSTAALAKLGALSTGEVAAFTVKAAPQPVGEVAFQDAGGKAVSLTDWRGKVVLLNLWATWCVPCRKEMPALDALAADLAGKDFAVVAVSTDRGGPDKPQKFLDEIGVKALKLYMAPQSVANGLGVLGMPTTLLIDRNGNEIGRLVGPAEWASADAKALVKAAIGG